MRYDVLPIARTIGEDTDYFYLNTIPWNKFVFDNFVEHIVDENNAVKPHLISLKYYETIQYEDVILLINGIKDPLDIKVGTKLKIPDIKALQEFLKKYIQPR